MKAAAQEWYTVLSLSPAIHTILEESRNPKPVYYICSKLAYKGYIPKSECKRYWPWVSKWLRNQEDVIAHRWHPESTDKKMRYILKENARKYYPEFLEGEQL
jgi:hypothetical protein